MLVVGRVALGSAVIFIAAFESVVTVDDVIAVVVVWLSEKVMLTLTVEFRVGVVILVCSVVAGDVGKGEVSGEEPDVVSNVVTGVVSDVVSGVW